MFHEIIHVFITEIHVLMHMPKTWIFTFHKIHDLEINANFAKEKNPWRLIL